MSQHGKEQYVLDCSAYYCFQCWDYKIQFPLSKSVAACAAESFSTDKINHRPKLINPEGFNTTVMPPACEYHLIKIFYEAYILYRQQNFLIKTAI